MHCRVGQDLAVTDHPIEHGMFALKKPPIRRNVGVGPAQFGKVDEFLKAGEKLADVSLRLLLTPPIGRVVGDIEHVGASSAQQAKPGIPQRARAARNSARTLSMLESSAIPLRSPSSKAARRASRFSC